MRQAERRAELEAKQAAKEAERRAAEREERRRIEEERAERERRRREEHQAQVDALSEAYVVSPTPANVFLSGEFTLTSRYPASGKNPIPIDKGGMCSHLLQCM